MKRGHERGTEGEMRTEYDFSGGVRGKHYERYRAGTNIVLLDPDVATVFRDSRAVNEALRLLIGVANGSARREPEPAAGEASSDRA